MFVTGPQEEHVFGVMRGLGLSPGCISSQPVGEDLLEHTPSAGNFDVEPKQQQPLVGGEMGKEALRDLHRTTGNMGWSWHHCSEQHQLTRAQSSCDTSQCHLVGCWED